MRRRLAAVAVATVAAAILLVRACPTDPPPAPTYEAGGPPPVPAPPAPTVPRGPPAVAARPPPAPEPAADPEAGTPAAQPGPPAEPSAPPAAAVDAPPAAGAYAITVRYLSPPPDHVRLAVEAARRRVEKVVRGDLPDVALRLGEAEATACGGLPPVGEVVDDLLLFVELGEIDGPGNTLAQAGPCVVRETGGLPVLGLLRVDAADLDVLQSHGFTPSVLAHEMLHVLGFGTLWPLASPPLLSGRGGSDPVFTGRGAVEAFLRHDGGASYSGAPVPVEGNGSAGTRDAHWRQEVLRHELMTGWISAWTQPLSRTTVASLGDLGYQVDLAAAEPFDLRTATGSPARAAGTMDVHDDTPRGPIFAVDEAGNLRALR